MALKDLFRHTFTNECTDLISQFAKTHQYDERKQFKEEWNKWIQTDEIEEMINEEIAMMKENGFDGDILDKMFKSARYYYRKKPTEKKEKKERKEYVNFSKELLENMDEHINMILDKKISPAKSYEDYVYNNQSNILAEIKKLKEIIDNDEFHNKFKKTYKNRFYILHTNNNI